MQIASFLRRIMLSVACLVPQYFQHYSLNGTIFGKNTVEHKM